MDRLNKMALRKIKESGNYNTFLRLKRIKKVCLNINQFIKYMLQLETQKTFI